MMIRILYHILILNMIRLIFRIVRNNADAKKLQNVSNKPFFKFYQNGVSLSMENKLQEANEQFKQSLNQIKNSKQQQLQHYSYILRRIAHNHRRMGQMKIAEEKLYDIIKHKRENQVNPATIYDDYDRLYKHMITYDLEKAVKLCKALLLKQKDDMPISHLKIFNLNLANAYLLMGNYNDAKNRYSKCLESDPQGIIKAYAYNNLGLACWWHKNPIQKVRDNQQLTDNNRIQKDFSQSKQLLAKSIQISESQNKLMDQATRLMLFETLNIKKGSLNNKLQFSSPDSIFGLFNLAQYFIANDPLQKVQILYWTNKALNLSKKIKNEKFFDRIFVTNSLLTNNLQSLFEILPQLCEKYQSAQQFEEQAQYSIILGRLLAEKDKQKSDQYLNRAHKIRGILPNWAPKLKYLAIDQLDLIH